MVGTAVNENLTFSGSGTNKINLNKVKLYKVILNKGFKNTETEAYYFKNQVPTEKSIGFRLGTKSKAAPVNK